MKNVWWFCVAMFDIVYGAYNLVAAHGSLTWGVPLLAVGLALAASCWDWDAT